MFIKENNLFKLKSEFTPSGDQPQAIEQIVSHFQEGQKHQVLLGVTGSGKTFTMAQVIEKLQEPTIILAPNKTLAAQLFSEFKELFPENAVEYFVSYYDYYQPEAFIPATNTYIEKDSAVNDQIDRMRHSATRSLFERNDVIIVSSVSCIYGLGSPDEYLELKVEISLNQKIARDDFLKELVKVQYQRNDFDFFRGTFRVRGDVVDVFPPYEDKRCLRVEFFGDFIDRICFVDALTGEVYKDLNFALLFPGSHYVTKEETQKKAIETIREELRERIQFYRDEIKYAEAERIEQRTQYDLEMIQEMGYCQGIENYSRHLTQRKAGEPPPTLLEYFEDDFLMIIDESHVTVPQVGGMYRGDRARKLNLVEHAYRLPSALDNRPLNFQEFENIQDKVLFVSATPGEFELKKSEGLVVEQIIRPTGLLDPEVEVRPVNSQVDDLYEEILKRVQKNERVLVTTLTKKTAEELTKYYDNQGLKVKYLHSDIKTVERTEIIRDLRLGVFDVLIGINLLREGLDIPEVSLVAITDADKEGFLRSERSLIQTIGRAARNAQGFVILYADKITDSMKKAIYETKRRRQIQNEYNKINKIKPQTVKKEIRQGLLEAFGLDEGGGESYLLKEASKIYETPSHVEASPTVKEIRKEMARLRKKMKRLADQLEFEEAAKIRDEVKRLELLELAQS